MLVRLLQTAGWQSAAPDTQFHLWRDTDQLRAGIVSGATRLLSIISMGHLYVISDDPAITTLADLRGRRVTNFFGSDMPDLVFRALLPRRGMDPGRDIDLGYVGTPMESGLGLNAKP